METMTRIKLYEGMFLVDSALANADWDGIIKTITTILEKAGAEIVSLKKWDERKLIYDIKRVSRGTYILCYFKVGGEKIRDIEKAAQLSEQIVRVLILNAEQMTAADIEKETPAALAEKMGLPQSVEESEKTEEIVAQKAPAVEQDFDADNQDIEENIPPL